MASMHTTRRHTHTHMSSTLTKISTVYNNICLYAHYMKQNTCALRGSTDSAMALIHPICKMTHALTWTPVLVGYSNGIDAHYKKTHTHMCLN